MRLGVAAQIRNWKLESGKWRIEIGNWKVESRRE
jgi:hypothetical protein